MYRLVQGTSLENLFDQALKDHPDWWAPPFLTRGRTLIILQNQNVIRWVQIRLTQAKKICGGLDIRIPDQALRGLLENLDWEKAGRERPPLLFMDSLKLLILHHLEKLLQGSGKTWDLLREFLGNRENTGSRLFGLANALAGSFSHYAQNEIAIPQAWRAGQTAVAPSHPAYSQEAWQKELWNRCFPPGEGPRLLGSLLEELMEVAVSQTDSLTFREGSGWDRILILGSPFLSRQALTFLATLGTRTGVDILHYLLVPAGPSVEASLEVQEPQAGWSRLYHGFRKEAERFAPEPRWLPPSAPAPGLLGLLQNRLRGLPADFSGVSPSEAPTLEFIACTTPKRQLEVLKDRLTLLLLQEGLAPQDMAVMAPDMTVFAPLVETVFQDESSGSLPHNLQEPDPGYGSRLYALKLLLSLGTGRLSRKEVLELCRHPVWSRQNGIGREELRGLEDFLETTHTLWAWDEDHRLEILPGYPGGENTWSRARDRLALSVAYGTVDRLVPGIQGPDIPADTEDPQAPARLILLLQDLRAKLQGFSKLDLTVGEWCRLLQKLAEEHLGPFRGDDGSSSRDELETVLQRLQSQAGELPEEIQARTWSWDLFFQMFLDQAERLDPGPGAFLVRGINFFSFRPLRTLPFKVIALLGMDEGAFPGMDSPPSFDLRSRTRTPIDQESTDLFTFLETLMAARERLLILWRGRDEVSGEERPPASPVQDLLDILEEQTGRNFKEFIRTAPVNPWSPVNFQTPVKEMHLPGTSPRMLETARLLAGGRGIKVSTGPLRLERTGEPDLGLLTPGRWTDLLTASVRFALQTGAGIYFEEETEHRDTENFSLDSFRTREYYRRVLETHPSLESPPALPQQASPEELLNRWALQGEWGNQALREWEKKNLEAGRDRLRELAGSSLIPGSRIREAELETLEDSSMKGRITWFESPSGGIVLPWPVGSSLEKGKPSEVALKHRIGALMGWIGLLACRGAGEPEEVTVLFYNGSRCQILEWKPTSPLFYSQELALDFLQKLKVLAQEMIRSPFPLYPSLVENLLQEGEGSFTPENLTEAWDQWAEGLIFSKSKDDRGESSLWKLLDRPGTCPYLKSAWEEDPPWDSLIPRMEAAARQFLPPFLAEKEEKP